MKSRTIASGLAKLALCAAAAVASPAAADVIDTFSDGVVNPTIWSTHGYNGGYGGVGAGSWQYSISEQIGSDSFLEAKVNGPASGMTYGAEAFVITQQNFNDGKDWLINFAWDTSIKYTKHCDSFLVQLTDGAYLDNCDWSWTARAPPTGSVNLYNAPTDWTHGQGDTPLPPFSKQSWSILIQDSQASLYTSPDAQGIPIKQVSLDANTDWHLRFDLNSATSAGFSQVENSFRLYDYSSNQVPDTSSLGIILLGAAALLARKK